MRENLAVEIDNLMLTDKETLLAEAQERLYKADTGHTWSTFADNDHELRTLIYGNTCHVNDHIESTNTALKSLFSQQEKYQREKIDFDSEVRSKVK